MRAVIYDLPKHWLAERMKSDAWHWDEVWAGVLHMPPPRTDAHSHFAIDLFTFLYQQWAKSADGDAISGARVTTPADVVHWEQNYRVADVVLLDRDNLHFDYDRYVVGPPLVVVMVRAPDDETYEKFPFYAALGVPEVWVFDRDTRAPELYALAAGPAYQPIAPGADGWLVSTAAGVAFRHAGGAKVAARVGDGPAVELPDG
ncbi:MAG: Uma2 family endonuclease [Gemmataceae bacterium]